MHLMHDFEEDLCIGDLIYFVLHKNFHSMHQVHFSLKLCK